MPVEPGLGIGGGGAGWLAEWSGRPCWCGTSGRGLPNDPRFSCDSIHKGLLCQYSYIASSMEGAHRRVEEISPHASGSETPSICRAAKR